jgi:branched-chain amino acid transport system ATP-binding protein
MLGVHDLHLSFGGIKALQGVSFTAQAGQITGVIGPNGAGKTSLFNAISGFYRPDTGRVTLDGQDVTALRPDKRAALGMARTFQNIALFRGMTVLDNIKLGAHVRLRSGVLAGLAYFGRARDEELALRADLETRIIDFLEIDHIRKLPVSACPMGCKNVSNWPARWPCARACCCWMNPWPA